MANAEPTKPQPTTTTQPVRQRTKLVSIGDRPRPEKIRVELNIEKWPAIWQPAKSKNKQALRILEREIKLEDGSKIVSRVEVGFNQHGTLTTEEQKMFKVLIKQWEDSGKPTEQVFFSDRLLAQLLHKGWGTNVIDSITKSLSKLRTVSLEWVNSFYDKTGEGKALLRDRRPFTMLSELRIIERVEQGAVNKALGYFRFDDHILSNLLANYTKPFLLDEFFKIKSDIGLLLYNHVDLIMANKSRYERSTVELFEDLGLKNAEYRLMNKRKRAIEKPLKELIGLRISSGVITSAIVEKTKDKKDYKVVVEKSSAKAEIEEAPAIDTVVVNDYSKRRDPLIGQGEDLVRHFHKIFHGIENAETSSKAVSQATSLIANHGFEVAKFIVEFSHEAAKETNFKVQTFGGIMQYESRALDRYNHLKADQETSSRRQTEHEEAQKRELDELKAAEEKFAALTEEEQTERREQARKRLLEEIPYLKNRSETHFAERVIHARILKELMDAKRIRETQEFLEQFEAGQGTEADYQDQVGASEVNLAVGELNPGGVLDLFEPDDMSPKDPTDTEAKSTEAGTNQKPAAPQSGL